MNDIGPTRPREGCTTFPPVPSGTCKQMLASPQGDGTTVAVTMYMAETAAEGATKS